MFKLSPHWRIRLVITPQWDRDHAPAPVPWVECRMRVPVTQCGPYVAALPAILTSVVTQETDNDMGTKKTSGSNALRPPAHSNEIKVAFPQDHVMLLTLNRPKALNAVSPTMKSDIERVLDWFDDESSLW